MKINSEKEQGEQVNLKMYNLKRKGKPKIGREPSSVFEEINRWNKGNGDFRARFYPAEFPLMKKKSRRKLDLGMVL